MMSSFKKLRESILEKKLSSEEQQIKVPLDINLLGNEYISMTDWFNFLCSFQIGEVKKIIGPIVDKFPTICLDASVLRFLKARNYNTIKAARMLRGTIKWRLEFKPDKIRWVRIKCYFFFLFKYWSVTYWDT
jgi:hypothetical protein